ncbi:MAG: STAS domain-containing protein [Phycisphaerales bacterium]|nr:STAS domain-containing protein [Phycisphaerales bacterium]
MASPSFVNIQSKDKAVLARIDCRELNHETTDKMKEALRAVSVEHPNQSMVLDLSQVEFIPSLALGAMVEVHHIYRKAGRKLILAGVVPKALEVMKLSSLDNLFDIYDDVQTAMTQA